MGRSYGLDTEAFYRLVDRIRASLQEGTGEPKPEATEQDPGRHDIDLLRQQIAALEAQVAALQADKQYLQGALDQAQQALLHEQRLSSRTD